MGRFWSRATDGRPSASARPCDQRRAPASARPVLSHARRQPRSSPPLALPTPSPSALTSAREHEDSSPLCCASSQRKRARGPRPALLAALVCLLAAARPALGSPPIDFFIYTSQLATAHAGTQNVSSILPSLKSIYAPPASAAEPQANSTSRQAAEQLSARVLDLVQNSSHTHDNNLADLEATRLAWTLMERQALLYMSNRVEAARPFVQELLNEAQVSDECSKAVGHWLRNLAELRQWAALMWNSWGQFPLAGVFKGSYTDLGSHHSCMQIEDNELIGEPQYCMLDFQPVVPTRPRFHSIFKRVLDYDAARQQLTGGDFDALETISSSHIAHNIASTRYKELRSSHRVNRYLTSARPPSLSDDERLLLASVMAADSLNNNNSKYSKRTIVHSSTGTNASSAGPQDSILGPIVRPLPDQLAAGAPAGPADETAKRPLNLTLKAEALVELALKAQYFYYVKFRIGACLPSKCSRADVKQLARTASQRAVLQTVQVNCMKKEPFSVNNYQLVAICILGTLALVAILGAIVDLLGYKENPQRTSAFINWLLPFSIYTNAKRLFDLETAGTHGDLECVHGLRFFSMIWVIYGHTILYMEYQSFTHFYDVVETQISNLMLLPSLNANFSVDTFFVISGILTTYVTWEYTKGDARKFNKFAFMISRYIRLTPQLAIVILCFFLLPLFGDGPMYRQVADKQAQLCYKNWAVNLLYLQSYVNSEALCIDPSWWLSIEMTFHVVSVLVIIVMIQDVRRGMIVNFVVAAALTLWGAAIHYSNGFAIQYLPSIPQRYEVHLEQTKLFFHRPYPHAASYFIGIALGYVLANKTVKKLSRAQLAQGWTVCALGLAVSLWGSYYWNLGAPYTQLQATLYYNLCQILWPVAIAWVILACSLGYGGWVNSILSARVFVPLGRVTYMTYLSHALIIYYHSARMNITIEPSMLLFTYLFIANTSLALALGVILTVVYESPILNLQKQLFTYLTQKFDPTVRDSQCLPSRLKPEQSCLGGLQMGHEEGANLQANGNTAILIEEQNALLLKNGLQMNGFEAKLYPAKNGLAATASCLLLNENSDKQVRPATDGQEKS